MEYKDIIPDQPIAEGYNSEPQELDVPDFPQGEQKVKTVKLDVYDVETGVTSKKPLGESNGELSPNPGYGVHDSDNNTGETKDATKIHHVEGSVEIDGGTFADQPGIKVEHDPVNFVGGLFVKGKEVVTGGGEGSENTPTVYEVDAINDIPEDILDELKVGDVVQKKTGEQKHCYVVTYKEEKHGICLTYVDGSGYMETISYDYNDGHWVFNSKDVTQVPTPQIIQSMLVGKYVRIMSAPTSTTLTDEQIAQIGEGAFIEGTFLGLKNPVLLPSDEGSGKETGMLISSSYFGGYIIENKVITKTEPYFSFNNQYHRLEVMGFRYPVAVSKNDVSSGDIITLDSILDKALKAHMEVEINGHRCRFESEEESGSTTYVIYSSFGEVSATGKLTANVISYNKSTREISFNQMTFTPDA